MAVTASLYGGFLKSLAAKQVNLNSDTFKVMLLSNSYTPSDTHQYQSDLGGTEITGTGYTAGGATLSSVTAAYTAAIANPTSLAQTPSGTGGTFAAGTYYWVVTAVDAVGESAISNEVTATLTGSTSSVALTWTAVTNATGYKVYRTAVGGGAGNENILVTTISSGSTVTYTDTGTAGTTLTPPTSNTTGGLIFTAANVSWASSTITAYYAVVVDTTPGTAGTNPLVGYINFGGAQSDTAGTFQINWNSTGIFVLKHS